MFITWGRNLGFAVPAFLGPTGAPPKRVVPGWFYHRVSEGVPFYHSTAVEKLLTVGPHHRPRTLPGMTRFGGAPMGPMIAGTANPKFRYTIVNTVSYKKTNLFVAVCQLYGYTKFINYYSRALEVAACMPHKVAGAR